MTIEVLKPGVLTSVQDLGRWGHQRFGVVVGGVMDEWSHRIANALVGNAEGDATLEITMMGPSLVFAEEATIAITGADLSPVVDGMAVLPGTSLRLSAGSRLDFGRRVNGMRAYLAVSGGIGVPLVMGSRSTYVRAGFGGFEGRPLRKGDVLPIGPARPAASVRVPDVTTIDTRPVVTIRFVKGRHWDLFTPEARAALQSTPYQISTQSDRMGYRLEGAALKRQPGADLVSAGVSFGTVQVPPDGQPIVLMADRQSTGGYPKIANVISVDCATLAQLAPRQSVQFRLIDLRSAQAAYLERESEFADACRA